MVGNKPKPQAMSAKKPIESSRGHPTADTSSFPMSESPSKQKLGSITSEHTTVSKFRTDKKVSEKRDFKMVATSDFASKEVIVPQRGRE